MPPYQRPVWTPPAYLRRSAPALAQNNLPPLYAADDPIFAGEPAGGAIPPKPSLDNIPIRRYSRIVPAEIVQHKLTPKPIIPMPDVEYMIWHFDEPQHDADNELRLYVALSREDIAIIKRWGLQYEVFDTMPLFDPADLATLQLRQAEERRAFPDMQMPIVLEIEHKQQMEWAEQQQIEITILDYLALPYRKQFENRGQMTLAQKKITSKLAEFKKKIDQSRGG